MAEPRTESVHSEAETVSDENTKEIKQENVSGHHGNARLTSNYFRSNDEYWKNSTHANNSSDDDVPLAERSTRRAAATTMPLPNIPQTSLPGPGRRRRGGPPLRENIQLYHDEDTSVAVFPPPVRRRRPNAPPSHGLVGLDVYKEQAVFETDGEMAKRLQDQFKRNAGLSSTAPYNARHTAGLMPDARIQWDGSTAGRSSNLVKSEYHDAPIHMQHIQEYTGARSWSFYPVYFTNTIPGHSSNQSTMRTPTAFSSSGSQAVSNITGQQHPAYDLLLKQTACWQNRFDHLSFRTSCNVCVAEIIPCTKHNPSLGFCYQHGLPRICSPALVHDAGLEDPYDALYEDSPRNMRRSSGVRKAVTKPKPPKVIPPKMQGAILRELRPKEDERGPPMA